MGPNERPTQERRVLKALLDAEGGWVSGQYFLREMYLSQYHARIFSLQRDREKYGYEGFIEASPFKDQWGFKSYRLVKERQMTIGYAN